MKSGFDFIDFWAVDFDFRNGDPFHHDWQDYRLRKDRSLKTRPSSATSIEKPGTYTACVKVVDIFGCGHLDHASRSRMTDAAYRWQRPLSRFSGRPTSRHRHRAKAAREAVGRPRSSRGGGRLHRDLRRTCAREVADWREGGLRRRFGHKPRAALPLVSPRPRGPAPTASVQPFAYYFCQREAIETLIYLYEVRGLRTLSGLTGEFAGADAERAALGISPEDDRWARYAFKIATGAGKTKIMSLAIVWSYFHALARARFATGAGFRDHRAEHHGLRAAQGGLQTGRRRPRHLRQRPGDPAGWRSATGMSRSSSRTSRAPHRRAARST